MRPVGLRRVDSGRHAQRDGDHPGVGRGRLELHLTLATTASDALPAVVLTALKGVTSFDVSAELAQQPGVANTVSPVSVAGHAQAPATLTAVPAATATGSAEFTSPGSGVIMALARR